MISVTLIMSQVLFKKGGYIMFIEILEVCENNWILGLIGECVFEAKVFDECSEYGINNGRVSKLLMTNEDGNIVASYDRGWDIEPNEYYLPHYESIINLFDNAIAC